MGWQPDVSTYLSGEHVKLLHILAALVFLVHFVYLSALLGGGTYSLIFALLDRREPNPVFRRAARIALPEFLVQPGFIAGFGILPLVSFGMIQAQLYGRAFSAISSQMLPVVACATLGFSLLAAYRRSSSTVEQIPSSAFASGGIGIAVSVLAYFQLSQANALSVYPEKWPFVRTMFPFFPVPNALPGFLLLTALALAVAPVISILANRASGSGTASEDRGSAAVRPLAIPGMLFCLAVPVLTLWHLYTLPPYSISARLFGTALLLAVGAIGCVYLYHQLWATGSARTTAMAVLALVICASYAIQNESARATAAREIELGLAVQAEKVHAAIAAEREERLAASQQVNGEEIFQNVCSACHRFDSRLVGPPLQQVVPQYRDRPQELVGFLLNPVKRNPDYPPMPNPGLKSYEARAVVNYLFERVLGSSPEEEAR